MLAVRVLNLPTGRRSSCTTISTATYSIRPTTSNRDATDDTQMSLAIAEAIVSREPWTPELLAAKFVKAFKRDRRVGYASKLYNFRDYIMELDKKLMNLTV